MSKKTSLNFTCYMLSFDTNHNKYWTVQKQILAFVSLEYLDIKCNTTKYFIHGSRVSYYIENDYI